MSSQQSGRTSSTTPDRHLRAPSPPLAIDQASVGESSRRPLFFPSPSPSPISDQQLSQGKSIPQLNTGLEGEAQDHASDMSVSSDGDDQDDNRDLAKPWAPRHGRSREPSWVREIFDEPENSASEHSDTDEPMDDETISQSASRPKKVNTSVVKVTRPRKRRRVSKDDENELSQEDTVGEPVSNFDINGLLVSMWEPTSVKEFVSTYDWFVVVKSHSFLGE
jgi:hypothetical protein